MSISVESRLNQTRKLNEELVNLATLENPTVDQKVRLGKVKGYVDSLRAGHSMEEMLNAELDELRMEAGLARLPAAVTPKIGAENERQWGKFARGEEVRSTYIPPDHEVRANEAGQQSIIYTTGPLGGTFVADQMFDRAMFTARQQNQIFEDWASNVIFTNNGALTAIPIADDISVSSVQVGETVQSNEVDVQNFGQVQLAAYTWRSKVVAISLELLQDSNFEIGAVLERIFAIRHALGVGAAYVTGSGTGTCTGLLTATVGSGAVPVIAAGSAANTGGNETGSNTIGSQDLVNLYKKLDPALRQGAVFAMQDATLRYFSGLLDKSGRPLFQDGLLGDDSQPYLMGKKVAICPSMPALGSGANSVILYQPQYFVTRRIPSSMYIRRFSQNPTLALYGLIGFESFFRTDSNLVAPNENYLPSQYIQNHS